MYMCAKNYHNRRSSDKAIAKIKLCVFLSHMVEYVILFCCSSFGCVLLARRYLQFAEDKVLVFVILRKKCENSATLSLT